MARSTYEALNLRALFKAANGAGEPERKGGGGKEGWAPSPSINMSK